MAAFETFWGEVDRLTRQLVQEERLSQLQEQYDTTNMSESNSEGGFVAFSDNAAIHGRASEMALQLQASQTQSWQTWSKPEESSEIVLGKIERVIEELMCQLSQDKAPSLSYKSRTNWENIRYEQGRGLQMAVDGTQTTIKFDAIQSVNRFALTVKILSLMYKLIQGDTFCTKRDLYYRDPQLFGSQSQVDDIVDNISCMLKVPRWNLHVIATSKGLLAGDLQYTDLEDTRVDCSLSKTGVMVPNHVQSVTDVSSTAKFILVVEKDATFQSLLDDGLCERLAPCIVITGKGFPDMNTRLMLRKLWDTLHIPVFALVDADPHGIEILSVYKFGSRSLSFESQHLTVPTVRWLGILPSDLSRLNLSEEALIPLSQADKDKGRELLKRPYFNSQPEWKKELEQMLRSGRKAEIQSLTSISSTFLTQVYLPNKIRTGGWI